MGINKPLVLGAEASIGTLKRCQFEAQPIGQRFKIEISTFGHQ
jgi:hypothetical protein